VDPAVRAWQTGDSTTATTHYNAALTIRERLADQDPTNTTAQRDLSISHNKLGNLALQTGDSTTATTHYNAARSVIEAAVGADHPWAVEIRTTSRPAKPATLRARDEATAVFGNRLAAPEATRDARRAHGRLRSRAPSATTIRHPNTRICFVADPWACAKPATFPR